MRPRPEVVVDRAMRVKAIDTLVAKLNEGAPLVVGGQWINRASRTSMLAVRHFRY